MLAAVAAVRWAARQRLAWRVDVAVDHEARQRVEGRVALH